MSTANLSFIAILLSCDTFFQMSDTADKMKDNNMYKSKEPESQTKYKHKWKRKKKHTHTHTKNDWTHITNTKKIKS